MKRENGIGRLFILTLLALSTLLHADASAEEFGGATGRYSYLFIGKNVGTTRSGALESVEFYGRCFGDWGAGGGRFVSDNISIEAIFEAWGDCYEREGVVLPGTYNNIMQVTSVGMSAAAVYHYTHNLFHFYAGAGAGLYNAGILVTHPDDGKLTDEGTPTSKWVLGYQARFGVDYNVLGDIWMGLELKKRMQYVDFDAYTGGRADVGGSQLSLLVSFGF